MRPISDEFLLNMAEISAALVGLFLVGMLFFIDIGFRRVTHHREDVEHYFRSSTRIVLVIFAIPLFLSLSLVALDLVWSRVLFVVLSLLLIAANLDSAIRIRPIARSYDMLELSVNEVLGTILVLILLALPWLLGGFTPTREHLTWAILIAFLIGFLSISAVVLSAFHLGRLDVGEVVEDQDQPPPAQATPITNSHGEMDHSGDETGKVSEDEDSTPNDE